MIDLESQVPEEANYGANLFARATDRGEEACERVRKRRVCRFCGRNWPPGLDLIQAARLRTETSGHQRAALVGRARAAKHHALIRGDLPGGMRAVVRPSE